VKFRLERCDRKGVANKMAHQRDETTEFAVWRRMLIAKLDLAASLGKARTPNSKVAKANKRRKTSQARSPGSPIERRTKRP
jgi:hypothetical protein